MKNTFRNIILVFSVFCCCHGTTYAQRKIKMKVIIEDSTQILKMKVHCKKGDLIYFSDSFIWASNRFDTTNIDRIAQSQIYLPEFYSSALYLMNDSKAYLYDYDQRSEGIDSLHYAQLLDLTDGYSFYGFISGNSKRVYRYKIPIWINPNILNTKPTKAAFYLRVKFDQGEILKEEILFDKCEIIYR
ncbi:MAG: hypothetical protein ACI8ZM_005764 [Crocinitomix sp.]|jgi:hypothetical protein